MTTLDPLTKYPTAMAKTEFQSLAGICHTGEFDASPEKMIFACELSDELERHIRDCGRLMQAAYAKWSQYGDFADHGEADHWRMAMEEAIKSRSPAQVARMEAERGLA